MHKKNSINPAGHRKSWHLQMCWAKHRRLAPRTEGCLEGSAAGGSDFYAAPAGLIN